MFSDYTLFKLANARVNDLLAEKNSRGMALKQAQRRVAAAVRSPCTDRPEAAGVER